MEAEKHNPESETKQPIPETPPIEVEKKPGIWTLVIGFIIIARAIMRYSDGGMNIFVGLMFAVGAATVIYYIAKQ